MQTPISSRVFATTMIDKRSDDSVRTLCKLHSLDQVVAHRRLGWLGHTARMTQDRLPYQCTFGQLSGTRAKGKIRDTWQSTVYKDLSVLHVQYNWFRLAHDQTGWRQLIASVCSWAC